MYGQFHGKEIQNYSQERMNKTMTGHHPNTVY